MHDPADQAQAAPPGPPPPTARPILPGGVTLFELWNDRSGRWIEREQPLGHPDGDPPPPQPEATGSQPDDGHEHDVERMVGEGGGQHHD